MGRQGRQSSLDELSPTTEVSRDTSRGQWKSGSLGMLEFIKFAVKKKKSPSMRLHTHTHTPKRVDARTRRTGGNVILHNEVVNRISLSKHLYYQWASHFCASSFDNRAET